MDRILRPEGAVIIRDHVDVIIKVKSIAEQLRWNSWMSHSENGAHYAEKHLAAEDSLPMLSECVPAISLWQLCIFMSQVLFTKVEMLHHLVSICAKWSQSPDKNCEYGWLT
ncbi:hypothetical protein ACLOJK_011932 [Asimina triloba]